MLRVFLSFAFIFCGLTAWSETRAAFVIGNSDYKNAPSLENPANDARLVSQTLESLGFQVSSHTDLSRNQMTAALSDFLKTHEDADVTLFYFAGHGMQFEGKNYLIGTDAALRSEFDVESETVELDRVVSMIERRSKAALIFIDACRDNPLAGQFYRENFSETRALQTRGLAPVKTSNDGAMLVFSAAPGQVAYDGEGENSPFAASLARHLPSENIEILSLMKRIIRDVKLETGELQTPVVTNDLTTEIYLNLSEDSTGSSLAFKQEETIFEAAVAIGTARAWDIYLRKFPNGSFTDLALAEQERLEVANLALASNSEIVTGKPIEISRDVARDHESKLGLSKDDNFAVQLALNERGYRVGRPDGAVGPRTRSAVADFQAASRLPITGVITKATINALGLNLDTFEESNRAIASTNNARSYDPDLLKVIETDKRLIKAAEALRGTEFSYGFYDGRLYIAALIWRNVDLDGYKDFSKRLGGYPVSLTTKAENEFVFDMIKNDPRMWRLGSNKRTSLGPAIGLYQKKGSLEPGGGWQWITNEPLGHNGWQIYEPTNTNNNEGAAIFMTTPPGNPVLSKPRPGPTWGDTPKYDRTLIVEIE